jgi:hypothetical protein
MNGKARLMYPENIAETKAKGLVGGAQRRRRREEAHFRFITRPPPRYLGGTKDGIPCS